MKLKNAAGRAWKYLKPNEMMLFLAGVFVVVAVLSLLSMYRNTQPFKSELRYENLPSVANRNAALVAPVEVVVESDKNARYAERVREASAIGLGMSLFLVGERVSKNRVLNITDAMREFSKSELLPPGVAVLFPDRPTSYGLLKTTRGLYYINYSPKPLKIEIIAGSFNGLADGAVFVLRVPDTSAAQLKPAVDSPKVSSAGAWATIFEAPENAEHYIPPPFSPVQTYTAMNWQVRPLQQAEMSPQRIQELNEFMQRQQ